MSFYMPEIIVESIIRDGIENMKQRPEVIDDVFAQLTRPYASRKYGASELQKIKDLLTGVNNQTIAVTHAFIPGEANLPSISIQLGSDAENKRYSLLGDYDDEIQESITDSQELADLVRVSNIIPTSYDSTTGMIRVPDSVDLSPVSAGFIFEDGSGNSFEIRPGISNDLGNKLFFIDKQQTVNITDPGEIRTFLDYTQTELKTVFHDVQLLLGIHTKDPLLTKYLYILTKYFLLSRKPDMIKRGLLISSLSGTDFNRDLRYQGDLVFTRFLTISGSLLDQWRSDQVDLIDTVEIEATPDCGCDDD